MESSVVEHAAYQNTHGRLMLPGRQKIVNRDCGELVPDECIQYLGQGTASVTMFLEGSLNKSVGFF